MSTVDEERNKLIAGLSLPEAQGDACTALQQARNDGYNFVTTTLCSVNSPTTRSDVLQMDPASWTRCIVGKLDETTATNMNDCEWAYHMNLPAVLLPTMPTSATIHNYASELTNQANKASATCSLNFQLWVPILLAQQSLKDWQLVYRMCGQSSHVGACLVLEAAPTNNNECENPATYLARQLRLLHVAIGIAPIRAITIPASAFLTNKRGYPTLSKSHQIIVCEIFKRIGRTIKIVVQGPSRHANLPAVADNDQPSGVTQCLPYLQYLNHLRNRKDVVAVLNSAEARLECSDEANYLDSLQRPLQPLKDHLQNQTYDVFEKDPIKYPQYQHAVELALRDRFGQQHQPKPTEVVVFVLGAGRGPLVTCVIQAYQKIWAASNNMLTTKLTVMAIEKNPSAVIYLKAKAGFDPIWKQAGVQVIHEDMRNLTLHHVGGKHCDIVVSELLGSFGCNELSPECLDTFFATEVCKSDTISIPQQYMSCLSLVSSAELHLNAQNHALYPNDSESDVIGIQKAMETPYVVRTHSASQLYDEQDCWTFVHPPTTNQQDLSRQKVLDFAPHPTNGVGLGSGYPSKDESVEDQAKANHDPIPPTSSTLTGLLGTFTAVLYASSSPSQERVLISTAPSNFSVGMFSWFPLYFPIIEPILIPSGAHVRGYIWRRIDSSLKKVWYEWSVAVHKDGELLSASPIHNPGGRSYYVSM